jgi:inner membrane transporter RhtA
LATTLFARLGPLGLAGWRCLVAAIIVLIISRPRLGEYERRAIVTAAMFGVTMLASTSCLYEAIERLPLATAVTISMLGPLAVSLLRRRRVADVLCAVVAVVGVIGVVGGLSHGSPLGLVFAFAQTLFAAASLIYLQIMARLNLGQPGMAIGLATAAILLLPFSIHVAPRLTSARTILSVLAVGGFGMVAPQLLELNAARKTSIGLVALLICLDPIAAAVIGWLALSQQLSLLELAGMATVLGATAAGSVREIRALGLDGFSFATFPK